MNRLYKYHGTISEMEAFRRTAKEIILHDMSNEAQAPARLGVGGGLARYIYEIEMTDAEERYIASDWYFDRTLYIRYIEVPSKNPAIPSKVIAQDEPWSEETVIFGPEGYIEDSEPEPMSAEQFTAWRMWRSEH